MRSKTDDRLRFASLQQTLEQALEGELALREGALVHRSQHFARLNHGHNLLKEISSDNLHFAQKIQFFQRFEYRGAVRCAEVDTFRMRVCSPSARAPAGRLLWGSHGFQEPAAASNAGPEQQAFAAKPRNFSA